MNKQTKQCQNCKSDFTIEPDDFAFYEKIGVPAPTFCPACRFQRRLMFRNERTLYKRDCDLCGKNTVSMFSPEKDLVVYCQKCWWSDDWDDNDYYLDYDPNQNIFNQMKELQRKTPHMSLISDYSTLVNSEYTNHSGRNKNTFLIFCADDNENCMYSSILFNCKDSMDCYQVGESELMYEVFGAGPAYGVFYSEDVNNSHDIYFSKDMSGCSDCIGCVGLRKKSYCIFNEQYTKDEYEEKFKELELHKYSNVMRLVQESRAFWINYPVRYMHGDSRNINVSGEHVWEAKNAKLCFQTRRLEDSAYCQFITTEPATNIYDVCEWGEGLDLCIESTGVGEGASKVKYSAYVWHSNTMDVEYSMYNVSCNNMFASINMKKKHHRVLNKQYTEEEFNKLRGEIIKSMNDKPYVDSIGRQWTYGEFFPYDLSPFDYSESHAMNYYQMAEKDVLDKGWRWKEPEVSPHKATFKSGDIPDSINDIQESIIREILGCDKCSKPYKVIDPELKLLKRFNLPIPRSCPDCRHMDRMSRLNPYNFWHRKCQCAGPTSENKVYTNTAKNHQSHNQDQHCPNTFETSYSPDRPEIVYCEQCYQAEVV